MSIEISKAMVDMFSANVMHLSQQSESRLVQYCRNETQDSESKFYDRIGKSKAKKKAGRHADIQYSDIPHSRRMVTMEDVYDADLVDQEDKIRVIMNVESEYAQALASSIAREQEEIIIDAALGNAYSGKKGTTAVALPNSQKVGCSSDATNFTGLSVVTLRQVRKKFKQNESIKKGEKIIFAMAAQQADDLLGSTSVTSSDYNTVKSLVDGEVDTFMGFKFVETELLPFLSADITAFNPVTGEVTGGAVTMTAAESRRCFAFTANRGLLCAKGREVKGRISELPKKHYAHQVYAALSTGATRMEEEQVVEVICKEV